jgi:NAD(P)-dependent dehydrogenase (short-subunit alcohol dehydrogenase family)
VYNRWAAYAQSKSANMLFSVSLAQKLGDRHLVSVSLHPGIIFQTGLSKDVAMHEWAELGRSIKYINKSHRS